MVRPVTDLAEVALDVCALMVTTSVVPVALPAVPVRTAPASVQV